MIQDSYQRIFGNKQRIMVVMAHPDDLEWSCGGLVARLIADGKEVRSVKMTSGDMGSPIQEVNPNDLKHEREIEDMESMKVLGINWENSVYLRIPDCGVDNTRENIGKIAEQIRIFQPELIITHNATDLIVRFDDKESWFNHPDHRATGQIVFDAAYPYARGVLFFPEQLANGKLKPWSCDEFLLIDYFNQSDNVFFEVTDFIEKRIEAHIQHKSQYNLETAQGMADFLTKNWDLDGKKNYETFRYIKAE